MQNEIKILNSKFEHLQQSSYISFQEVASLVDVTGVYIIYNHNNEILYIGNTNKFHIRFGTDLKHETTHTLVRKLLKNGEYKERKEVVQYLMNKCQMKVEQCATKREAEALEHIAIYVLNPLLNK